MGVVRGEALAAEDLGGEVAELVAVDEPLDPVSETDEHGGPADMDTRAAGQRGGEADGGARGPSHGRRLLAAARNHTILIVIPALPGSPNLPAAGRQNPQNDFS
jgi:hypothetical protein